LLPYHRFDVFNIFRNFFFQRCYLIHNRIGFLVLNLFMLYLFVARDGEIIFVGTDFIGRNIEELIFTR